MKTSLILVSLVVLSSLSIYAQEDIAPDDLLASIDVYDTDPPIVPNHIFRTQAATDLPTQSVMFTSTLTKGKQPMATNSMANFQKTSLLLTTSINNSFVPEASSPAISELDYSTLYQVKDYDYFLKEGGLRLQLFR